MNYIELCRRAINDLVDEEVDATKAFIRDELQPPSREEVAKMIAKREIAIMRRMEQEAGLG